ncbi:MAG: uroporphyrinogen decarboxylase family protein [Hydrogeniiclostridium sp.]
MDKRTRVLNALNKKPVDHVPVGFWFHFAGEETVGENFIKAQMAYYKDVDMDFIKIMSDGYFYLPLSIEIEKASDWNNLKPLTREDPFIKDQVWRVKRMVEEAGKECCLFYNVFAPFTCMRFAFPDEVIMQHLREDKHAVMHALDVIAQDQALLSELVLTEGGCDGIYYCVQGGEIGRFSTEEYKAMIAPSDMYVLEHANRFSENNILHCCGWVGAKNNLSLWKDYPSKCVNWAVFVEELSLENGRFFFGDRAVLGGFETLHLNEECTDYKGLLYHGTKEEIQKFTKDTILRFGKRGLILGGDCTIGAYLDHERIRWVIEAAREI